jgi:hypothetical protein
VEEVAGQHRGCLRAQELPPGRVGAPDRRWRDPQPLENAADRRGSHAVAEFEQLALDSLVSPALIFPGYAFDQQGHSVLDGWTSDAVGIRPFLGDQATMPAQHRARSDQTMPPQHPRQPPDQRGEHGAIRPVQARPRVGSAQHGDFVAQRQEFNVLGCRRAAEQQQQVHKLEEDQVEQTQRHGSRSCPVSQAHRPCSSEAQTDFWNPGSPARRCTPGCAATAKQAYWGWPTGRIARISTRISWLVRSRRRSASRAGGVRSGHSRVAAWQ